ncbi:MAG: hypothetical protein VYD05_05250, partial [Planctomycetota bacterium]|nr:hypothetical protein [Planctomycetota bacterium]
DAEISGAVVGLRDGLLYGGQLLEPALLKRAPQSLRSGGERRLICGHRGLGSRLDGGLRGRF